MQHILYSVFSYSMCQCYVTCLVYINKHTPLTHIQRLFYRNWCNKTSLLQTPPSLHPRALIGLTRQHLVSHWCLHVSVRAWSLSAHGGNEATLTPIKILYRFFRTPNRIYISVNLGEGEKIFLFLRWWNVFEIVSGCRIRNDYSYALIILTITSCLYFILLCITTILL